MPLDHPEDRAAVDDFGLAFGPHAGDVPVQAIGAFRAARGLPFGQTFDALRADAEFDEVGECFRHGAPRRFL